MGEANHAIGKRKNPLSNWFLKGDEELNCIVLDD